jgi:tetratricopeptide (TPR) repeat protein
VLIEKKTGPDMGDAALSRDEDALLAIALAIADGTSVDWSGIAGASGAKGAEVEPPSGATGLLKLELVVQGHRVLRHEQAPGETLLTSSRRSLGDAADGVRVEWGPLVVLDKIGRGAFGDVYRAWDPRLDREVALKLLRQDTTERFGSPVIDEGRLLARVRHPNVVTVYGAERSGGRAGIWMEYLRGHTLAREVSERGPLAPGAAAHAAIQVAHALEAVHAAGLVHRDVKAHNVMRDETGRIVLGDFGTGLALNNEDDVAPDAQLAGTPLYLAPEVLEGQAASIASDLYSLGVLLYFLVSGRHPVEGRSLDEIRAGHRAATRMPLASVAPGLSREFIASVERLLDPSPERRFPSAHDAATALQALSTDERKSAPAVVLRRGRTSRGIVALASLVVVTAVLFFMRDQWPLETPPAVTLTANDWVLVTSFANDTGESVFDGTLQHVFRQELSRSSTFRVASSGRVRDALALMRRPPDQPVDVALAREISRRDHGIRVLAAGSAERVGTGYALAIQLISPGDRRVLATDRRTVEAKEGVLEAVIAQARWARRTLGDDRREISTPRPLERASTESLDALQLYSQGAELGMQGKWSEARDLFVAAIEHDPAFASAHILLAWAISHAGPESWSHAREQAKRALDRADTVSDPERHFIEGSYLTIHAMVDQSFTLQDVEKQAKAYEAVLRDVPDHYFAATNLLQAYTRLGRTNLVVQLALKLAGDRPNDVQPQSIAARTLTSWSGDLDGASLFIARVASLKDAGLPVGFGWRAWTELFEAHRAWVRGDLPGVRTLVDRVAATLTAERDDYALLVGSIYLGLGRCGAAREAYASTRPDFRHEALAVQALQCDDPASFASHLLSDTAAGGFDSADRVMWGPLMRRPVAQQWIDEYRRGPGNRFVLDVADGNAAAIRGDWTTAAAYFEKPWALQALRGQDITFQLAEHLAEAHIRAGQSARALEVLEATTPLRARAFDLVGGAGWMPWIRAQAVLARLYRQLGRIADAAAREAEIRSLLTEADPDLPLLRRLGEP